MSDSAVITQLYNFKNWKKWFPSFQDSNVLVTISNQNGQAELRDNYGRIMLFKMLSVSKNRVDVELYVKGKSTTTYQFILKPVSTGTTDITWNIVSNMGWYPWKKLQGIVLDKFTGEQYVSTLQKLKEAAENHSAPITSE